MCHLLFAGRHITMTETAAMVYVRNKRLLLLGPIVDGDRVTVLFGTTRKVNKAEEEVHSIYYIDFRKKRKEKNKHTTTSFRSWLLLVRKCMSYTYNVFVIYLSFIHEKKKGRKIEAGAPSVLSTIFQFGIRTLWAQLLYNTHTNTQ